MARRGIDMQTLHDQMVKVFYDFLSLFYRTVYADLPGYSAPPPIPPHRPDIFAEDNNNINDVPDVFADLIWPNFIVGEVETCDTLDITHTQQQFTVFASYARKNGGEFWVMVPHECLEEAISIWQQWFYGPDVVLSYSRSSNDIVKIVR